ncbi:MAG: hypothetical protein IV090_21620 [Candidatus Sericytochromatia bacterium]|nr:hypothetical protein [Candidatus Sericytochromatia bacterium]
MKARLVKLSSLLMGTLLLLPGCGDILKQNAVLTGGCTSAYRSQSLQINQVTNVSCSGTGATTPTSSTYPTTGTGYPAATTQPIQGGQAVATPGGYAYQNAQTQVNPYAGAVFPSGSYGTGYGSSNPYGSYPANPTANAGYGSGYATGTNTAATYGTGTYGSAYGTATQAGYGTGYATGTNTAATYGTGTYGSAYGTAPQAGYGTAPQANYGTYAAPRAATQTAAQGTGYIQYNVNQAQQNQAKR